MFFIGGGRGAPDKKNWRKKYTGCHSPKESPISIDEDLTQVNANQKKLQSQSWDQTGLETGSFMTLVGKQVKCVHLVWVFNRFVGHKVWFD